MTKEKRTRLVVEKVVTVASDPNQVPRGEASDKIEFARRAAHKDKKNIEKLKVDLGIDDLILAEAIKRDVQLSVAHIRKTIDKHIVETLYELKKARS